MKGEVREGDWRETCWLEMEGGALAAREMLTHGNSLLSFFSVSCLTYP